MDDSNSEGNGSGTSWEHTRGNKFPSTTASRSLRTAPCRPAPPRPLGHAIRQQSAVSPSRTFQDRRKSMIVERHVYARPTMTAAEQLQQQQQQPTPPPRPHRPPPGYENLKVKLPEPMPSRSGIIYSGATLTRRGAHREFEPRNDRGIIYFLFSHILYRFQSQLQIVNKN